MNPIALLEKSVEILRKVDCTFAVAGGLAGNFFRKEPRLTKDVDLALWMKSPNEAQSEAVRLVEALGFQPGLAKESDLKRAPMMNKRFSPVVLVVGRKKDEPMGEGLDVILPRMQWVEKAVERAQVHQVDFGFDRLPMITVEDFILAKLVALDDNPSRFKDMDDLQSIFESKMLIDAVYLAQEAKHYKIHFPRGLKKIAPKEVRRAFQPE